MKTWNIRVAEHGSERLERYLCDGWEPFAVTREPVHNNPDSSWKITGHEPHVWLRRAFDPTVEPAQTPTPTITEDTP